MRKILITLLLVILFPSLSMAGGPFVVNDEGIAATWDNSSDIEYNPESGRCATFSNGAMLIKIATNIGFWADITDVAITFDGVTGLVGSVDSSNYEDFFVDSRTDPGLTDGLNPVIFDDDGEIIADLFGTSAKFFVLGFAGPDGFQDNFATIVDGQAFFNCFCLAGNPEDVGGDCASNGVVFTEDDLDFTMMHEFGHFLGFDHTQVNQDIAEGSCDTGDSDALVKAGVKFVGGGDCDAIPSMYPESVDPADQITPMRDDEVIALTLYGNSTWEDDLCEITGALVDKDGDQLRCADVQAIATDPEDTSAVESGGFAPQDDENEDLDSADSGECLSDCGDFALKGLDPSLPYTVTVLPISSAWTVSSGSSIGPCGIDQPSGIVEEEIFTVNDPTDADTIDCGAGESKSIGSFVTTSSGGVTPRGGGSSGGSDGSSRGCSLSQNSTSKNPMLFLFIGIPLVAVFGVRSFVRSS